MDNTIQPSALLAGFLQELNAIPGMLIQGLSKSVDTEDERDVINAFSETLKSQFSGLSETLTELAAGASRQSHSEAERLLKIASVPALMTTFKSLINNPTTSLAKLGIQEIVFAIKKLIREIFKLLGKELPKWLDALLIIIDEIFNFLFGGNSPKLRQMLSQNEQNFLAELTLLTKLQNATGALAGELEDED